MWKEYIDDQIDVQYKAGLYHQFHQFIADNTTVEKGLLTIEKAIEEFSWYEKMLGE